MFRSAQLVPPPFELLRTRSSLLVSSLPCFSFSSLSLPLFHSLSPWLASPASTSTPPIDHSIISSTFVMSAEQSISFAVRREWIIRASRQSSSSSSTEVEAEAEPQLTVNSILKEGVLFRSARVSFPTSLLSLSLSLTCLTARRCLRTR